jgi:hypothetical protein
VSDRKAGLKAAIEIADRVLWETRGGRSYNWMRDYFWLECERARLARELDALNAAGDVDVAERSEPGHCND